MIPKVIHYCWFGHNPLPDETQKCIASWRKFFPDYEIKEWNESNFDVNSIAYTKEAYRLKKYAFVSDYARFWILYKFGGLYFDTDVEVLRPMDDIVARGSFMGYESNETEATTLGVAPGLGLGANPGLGLGANPGLGLYRKVLTWYQNHHFATWNGKFEYTVVNIVSRLLDEKPIAQEDGIFKYGEIFIYPPDYFCPKDYLTGHLNITDNTRTIHHYSSTWVKDKGPFLSRVRKRFSYFFVRFLSFINL